MELDQGVRWHGSSSLRTSKTTGALGKSPEGSAPEGNALEALPPEERRRGARWEPGEDGNQVRMLHPAGVLRAGRHTGGRPQCLL